jgi:hypothetical protein
LAEYVRLLQNNYIIEILSPRSSDQAQPCDLRIFEAMKADTSRIHLPPALSKQSKYVIKMVGSAETTTSLFRIVHAFSRAGIRSHYSQENHCLICQVDCEGMDAIRGVDLVSIEAGMGDRLGMHCIHLSQTTCNTKVQ